MKLVFAALIASVVVANPAFAQLAPPNADGITYGHVHLNVKDIEVHKKFWAEYFGGVPVTKGTLTAIKFPNMLIALTQREPQGGSMGTVMDHFGFKVQSVAEILAKWRAGGMEVQSEFIGAEGFPNAYLMGPDGVRIELQEDKTQKEKVVGYHIHFQTPDYDKLLTWYTETFNLARRQRGSITTTTDVPGMNLSFANSRTPTVGTRGRAIDHIGFEVKNLEAFCKKLEAKGIKLDVPYRDVPSIGLKIAFLTDPSGTYIELTEGFDKY
jgi:catechol 2,3-dioxygenase-like lactoylglutathione lyase family enzyme